MSTSVAQGREPPPSKPLDEALWQTWAEKGRARDRRNYAAGLMAVKGLAFGALLVIAALWPPVSPYDVVTRFVVAAGAIVLMLHAIRGRHYAVAAVFGMVALLYNPVAPMFSFWGGWSRLVFVISAAPVVASLAARNLRTRTP